MTLQSQYNKFLRKYLGPNPSKNRMRIISKEVRSIPKKGSAKKVYNDYFSKLWKEIISYDSNPKELSLIKKHGNLKNDSNITSIASGFGIIEFFIAKHISSNGKTTLIDISEEMTKEARKYKKIINVPNTKIKLSNARKTKVKSNSQDLVLSRRSGLSPTNKWPAVLKEVNRILKKSDSARFIYTVGKRFSKTNRQIKIELLKANLKLVKTFEFNERSGTKNKMIISEVMK